VSTLLKERLPATLELAFAAALLALVLGVRPAVYTALRRDSWLSQLPLAVSDRRVAADLPDRHPADSRICGDPGWLPSPGRGDTVALGWWTTGFLTKGGACQGTDPAGITLSPFQMTLIMRLVRAEMLEVPRTDYIAARARGPPTARAFRPRTEKHAGLVINDHRVAARRDHRLRIITETVFQAGMALFIQAVSFARCPGDGGLPVLYRTGVRVRSTGRRSVVPCGRPEIAHRTPAAAAMSRQKSRAAAGASA
jgi:peptide/nickel transport system permease protein